MKIKKAIGKIHLWLGLASGLIVFIVSITGAIYVFREEIFSAVHKDLLYVDNPGTERLSASEAWDIAQGALGEESVINYTAFYQQPNQSWAFMTYVGDPEAVTYFGMIKEYRTAYVNPYTGEVLGVMNNEYEFFSIIKNLHWSLLLSTKYGQSIVGWSTFIFVVMLISGIVLWWPKNKAARKQRFSIKKFSQWRRFNYDLHNVLGFYISLVALIIAFTGMVWAFTWFKGLVYVAASGTTVPPKIEQGISKFTEVDEKFNAVNTAYHKALAEYPDMYGMSISKPHDSTSVVNVTVQQLEGLYYKQANLQYDQYSGELLIHRKHSDKNFGEKLITANYDIHVGAILGLPGKILAFIASIICTSLPVTGFLIWWGRRNKNDREEVAKPTQLRKTAKPKLQKPKIKKEGASI